MKRPTLLITHAGASALALLTILIFFTSTVLTEILGSVAAVAVLKERIFFALPLLLVAMPVVGLSGKKLAGTSKAPLLLRKQRRMKFIASNGLVLVSLACLLYYFSRDLQLGTTFYLLQGLELLLGAVNIGLMLLSVRDGLLLSGRFRKKQAKPGMAAKKVTG